MANERQHTRFSPSRSEQFFLCPGSVNLLARTPSRPTSIYALEGEIAHTVLEAGLRNRLNNATDALEHTEFGMGVLEELYGEVVKNVNEFKASINDALDYVWNLVDTIEAAHGDAQLFIEVRVDPPITSSPGEAAGYCDIAIYSAKARHLWVIDYKHGAGVAKAAVGNTQVKQYAAGFLYDDSTPVDKNNVDHVTLAIIQPRAFHADGNIREYTTNPLELADYLIELDEKIEEAMRPDAPLVPGVEQCRFCDARSTCPAVEAKALAAVNTQFANVRDIAEPKLPAPSTLDIARLAYIAQVKPLIMAWFNDVDRHLYELMMNGTDIPGLKLVEAQARREWHGEEKERAEKLAAVIGCDVTELYRATFKTITDVEKMMVDAFKDRVGRGKKKQAAEDAKQMFAYFTTKQSSGNLSVVSEDDPRPPANRALSSFNQVVGLLPSPTNTQK